MNELFFHNEQKKKIFKKITQAQIYVIPLSKWKILNWNAVHKSQQYAVALGRPSLGHFIDLANVIGLTRAGSEYLNALILLP